MTRPGTARTTRLDRSRLSTLRRGKRTDRRAIGTAASVATTPAAAAYPNVFSVASASEAAAGSVLFPPA